MNWIEITATFPEEPEDWSPVIDLLDRLGCPNTLQNDGPPRITACVVETEGSPQRVAEIESALKGAGASVVVADHVPDRDWQEIWRAHFKPRRVGKRFTVCPTWEQAAGDLTIVLDPGQAFGTGDHPTTRMCLELLEKADVSGRRVLDLGCGSGILSIGAALLGAAEVLAIDNDPQSVEVAHENVVLNDVAVVCELGDRPAGEEWDIALSNIISAALINLAPSIKASLTARGSWIVSGIIEQNWPDVRSAAANQGFSLGETLFEDGWVAARFDL